MTNKHKKFSRSSSVYSKDSSKADVGFIYENVDRLEKKVKKSYKNKICDYYYFALRLINGLKYENIKQSQTQG